MAEWRPLHQRITPSSGLETGAGPYNPPLLPYEKALIQAIGCSEDEYRELVRHAMLRQRVRPAEYDHIPDIVNEPVTIAVISLVVGLASTAASVLLAPKAPTFEEPEQKKIRGKKLADQIGPTRFNQATNFDNIASLAALNQPIPIPFGKKGTGKDGVLTGGLILAPALVWSRVYAYGTYQAFEGVYVAGEHGIANPPFGGILIGTSALNSLGNKDFAFYWSSTKGNNRPTPAGLLYGTQGPGATGTVGKQIFTSPTADGQFSNGFSMAYTPGGDTTFGTSTPIHNGSVYRFNWEIISAPFSTTKGPDNEDARFETQAKRRKIAGSLADVLHIPGPEAGQPGTGRAYSRHMGFVQYNGTNYENRTIIDNVALNDVAVFEIDNRDSAWKEFQKENFDSIFGDKTEINLEDLINSAKGWRERASELLAVGSKWIISASNWVVESRYDTGDGRTYVNFRCVAILGVANFGVAGRRTVEEPLGGNEGAGPNPEKHCGAAFFNVCRLNVATIRPVRRDAEVIELGIKSQVWNRASGLCNFNAIPSPARLFKLDKADVQLTTPRMDKYFRRSSCFSIWVRPVQEYNQGQQTFKRIPRVFVVQGRAPIDQNNWIRIRPKGKAAGGYFEYRLIPRTGSDIAINSIDSNAVTVLDAADGTPYLTGGESNAIGEDYDVGDYGTFRITTHGRVVSVQSLRENGELFTNPGGSQTIAPESKPAAIGSINYSSNSGNPFLIINAFLTQALGLAKNFPGQKKASTTFTVTGTGGKSVSFVIEATSVVGILGQTIGPMYLQANGGSPYIWDKNSIAFAPVSADGEWEVGDKVSLTLNTPSSNPFKALGSAQPGESPYSSVTVKLLVTAVQQTLAGDLQKGERGFELNSQVADCSHYTELTKSNESRPEHEVVYVNEYISNLEEAEYDDMTTVGLSVKSSGEIAALNQLRVYTDTGIPVERLADNKYLPSNKFSDLVYYLLTNKTQGVGNTVPAELVDKEGLTVTSKFLAANKIFFDGVIEDSQSFRSFLYDNASLQMCNFTIKNGRFGMQPALPYDGNYEISLNPIVVDQIFTAGNIIEDSLQLQYIDISQRSNIRALVTWRVTKANDLPYEASALLEWADLGQAVTEQAFDLSDFCTNRDQALRTAQFLMSTRRRVTKTVSFKTVPDALGVQPGSYIRVITEASTYNAEANGAITDAGTLVSVTQIKNGTYNALIYDPAKQEVLEAPLTISNNTVTQSKFHGTLFTLLGGSTDYSVYQIEQLSIEEDGLVAISAVEVPTDASGVSLVAKDVLTPSNFTILE